MAFNHYFIKKVDILRKAALERSHVPNVTNSAPNITVNAPNVPQEVTDNLGVGRRPAGRVQRPAGRGKKQLCDQVRNGGKD